MVVERFPVNTAGRDFVAGDIHGCFAALEHLLGAVGFEPAADRCFCVGDLIDRGPQSEQALQWLAEPWFHSVRGNHDEFPLHAEYDDATALTWMRHGGQWWWDLPKAARDVFRETLSSLPVAIEIETKSGRVGIVHADVPSDSDWDDFVARVEAGEELVLYDALWSRLRYKNGGHSVGGVDHVYVGHKILDAPVADGNVRCLDLGAFKGETDRTGALCLAEVGLDLAHVLPIIAGQYGTLTTLPYTGLRSCQDD